MSRNNETDTPVTRRRAIAAVVGGAAVAAAAAGTAHIAAPAPGNGRTARASSHRMPVVYLPHGGGPWPFVDVGFGDPQENDALASYLRGLHALPPSRPTALLVISAHWEARVLTVMTGERPPLFFDYYGFPPES